MQRTLSKALGRTCLLLIPTISMLLAAAATQLQFSTVDRDIVEARLKSYKGNDSQREATLKGFFQEEGCTEDKLIEQPVKGLKQPNIICELPGTTDSVIVVGAHFDHVDRGDGVVDNWSGASMLPSLYQALKNEPRRYSFRFISFAGEEKGLV
ncbi:MAG TPA: M28 family peptidase, partial [Terriglobales bacterium]|nr:M28 family peptidase [Terriglobales bacterium]